MRCVTGRGQSAAAAAGRDAMVPAGSPASGWSKAAQLRNPARRREV